MYIQEKDIIQNQTGLCVNVIWTKLIPILAIFFQNDVLFDYDC